MQAKIDNWKCTIADGMEGDVKLETFEVDASGAAFANMRGAGIREGVYKRLYIGHTLMMSDTPKERRDHSSFIHKAKGHVLINGLGMGCCLNSVINSSEVESVTVIESNENVIKLVGGNFPDAEIIHADAFEWKSPKGKRYGAVWHDIWADISLDNLPEMHKLHRKYGRKADWQGSWSRGELEYYKSRERRY